MNSGKLLLGLLAGVAAGATLGILFAPDKGTATRRKITRKGDAYAEGLNDKFNEFVKDATNKFESMKEDAYLFVENGTAPSEDGVEHSRKQS